MTDDEKMLDDMENGKPWTTKGNRQPESNAERRRKAFYDPELRIKMFEERQAKRRNIFIIRAKEHGFTQAQSVFLLEFFNKETE